MGTTYYVYVHSNKINGKRYVGITSNPKRRWEGGSAYNTSPHFKNSINKYGWDGFTHYFLASGLTADEAKQMESEYIAKYNTTDRRYGYNETSGGELSIPTEEVKRKIGASNRRHGETKTRLHRAWESMKRHRVPICDEWKTYEGFRDWSLANGYTDELSLCRLERGGEFSPTNCKWAPRSEYNRRTRRNITFNGETKTISEWAKSTGLKRHTIKARIDNYGWSIEKALTTPPR